MTLGITGHQDLSNFDRGWIKWALRDFLLRNNVQKGLSSLAIGADQLFANELRIMQVTYDAIIPCKNYELTFKKKGDLQNYLSLRGSAENIFYLDFQEPNEEAFYAGGIEIVQRSSTIMAIWDGEVAKGLGGTGDVVKVALQKGIRVYQINPLKETIFYLEND